MEERQIGTVKWFNNVKGYGFITSEKGDELFVKFSDIKDSILQTLSKGQTVSFIAEKGEKGMQAIEVISVSN